MQSLGVTDHDTVVQRFLSRQDEPLKAYRGSRRLEAASDRFKKQAWIDAATEMTPDGRFTYRIVDQGGSEYILDKVLRPFLEGEAKAAQIGDPSRTSLTSNNYELQDGGSGEPGVAKLFVRPKRRDMLLVEGAVFVSEDKADLLRIEGRLSKNPSFWTRRVDVVRYYGRVAGVRVPIRLESVAQVRLAGRSTMTVTYDYDMVNGIQVDGRAGNEDPVVSRGGNDPNDPVVLGSRF